MLTALGFSGEDRISRAAARTVCLCQQLGTLRHHLLAIIIVLPLLFTAVILGQSFVLCDGAELSVPATCQLFPTSILPYHTALYHTAAVVRDTASWRTCEEQGPDTHGHSLVSKVSVYQCLCVGRRPPKLAQSVKCQQLLQLRWSTSHALLCRAAEREGRTGKHASWHSSAKQADGETAYTLVWRGGGL